MNQIVVIGAGQAAIWAAKTLDLKVMQVTSQL